MLNQLDTSKTMLTQYAYGPSLLDSALAGLSESDLDLALNADSWSIRQIVHHIVDGDDLWKICIKTALGNSEALFSLRWYTVKSQMEWSENWAYTRRSIEPSLAMFHANRRHIVDLLEHIPGACEKSIRFQPSTTPEMCITILDVIELHIRHLSEHIETIQAIRKAHGI